MKKFLSLVLALVMTMSLVTISAGATEYKDLTDKDEIQYEEAVAVLNRIGVITGYDDGSFRPTTELTRGAAAKIIVSLLIGPEAASNLPNTYAPYPDVPAGHTFAGVISYCKTKGIISGYGDGTFKPANTLTGYAFAKMLLGAVGYDANLERFVDTGWTMNVAAVGQSAGLFDRLQFDGGAAVTREQACQLALNALKATVVQYSQGINVNVTGDNTNVVVSGGQTRSYKTSNQEFAKNIRVRYGSNVSSGNLINNIATDYYTVEFAEEHFVDLRLEHDKYSPTADDFGRPSSEWSYKKVTIGTYPLEPDFGFKTQVAHLDATNAVKERALGLKSYDLHNDAESEFTNVWVNGKLQNRAEGEKFLTDLADISDYTDNGTVVEVYVSNDDADFITDVVVVQTQLMEVKTLGSDYVALDVVDSDNDEPIEGYNQKSLDKKVQNVRVDDEYYDVVSALKKGDKVAVIPVTTDGGTTYSVAKAYVPETVSGQLTRVTTYGGIKTVTGKDPKAIDITVGGTTYNIANWNKDMADLNADKIKVTTKDVTLLLDEFGNALLAKNVGSTSDYMVVGAIAQTLVNGRLVYLVEGWDGSGTKLSLNVGTVDPRVSTVDTDGIVPGDLVFYTNERAVNNAEWRVYGLRTNQTGSPYIQDTTSENKGIFQVDLDTGSNLDPQNYFDTADLDYRGKYVTVKGISQIDADQLTAPYDIKANNVRLALEGVEPGKNVANEVDLSQNRLDGTRYFAKNVKFIYVSEDTDTGEVDTIEIYTGVQNVDVEDLSRKFRSGLADRAEAYVNKDGYVEAVVIKTESNNALSGNLAFIIRVLGSHEYNSENNTKYYGYQAAIINGDSFEVKNIFSTKALKRGDFATYSKAEDAEAPDPNEFYTLKEYTKTMRSTSVMNADAISRVNPDTFRPYGGNKYSKDLLWLGNVYTVNTWSKLGVPGNLEGLQEANIMTDVNVINENPSGDEPEWNLVRISPKVNWIDATAQGYGIDDIEELVEDYSGVLLSLVFNDDADSDGFRTVSSIVVLHAIANDDVSPAVDSDDIDFDAVLRTAGRKTYADFTVDLSNVRRDTTYTVSLYINGAEKPAKTWTTNGANTLTWSAEIGKDISRGDVVTCTVITDTAGYTYKSDEVFAADAWRVPNAEIESVEIESTVTEEGGKIFVKDQDGTPVVNGDYASVSFGLKKGSSFYTIKALNEMTTAQKEAAAEALGLTAEELNTILANVKETDEGLDVKPAAVEALARVQVGAEVKILDEDGTEKPVDPPAPIAPVEPDEPAAETRKITVTVNGVESAELSVAKASKTEPTEIKYTLAAGLTGTYQIGDAAAVDLTEGENTITVPAGEADVTVAIVTDEPAAETRKITVTVNGVESDELSVAKASKTEATEIKYTLAAGVTGTYQIGDAAAVDLTEGENTITVPAGEADVTVAIVTDEPTVANPVSIVAVPSDEDRKFATDAETLNLGSFTMATEVNATDAYEITGSAEYVTLEKWNVPAEVSGHYVLVKVERPEGSAAEKFTVTNRSEGAKAGKEISFVDHDTEGFYETVYVWMDGEHQVADLPASSFTVTIGEDTWTFDYSKVEMKEASVAAFEVGTLTADEISALGGAENLDLGTVALAKDDSAKNTYKFTGATKWAGFTSWGVETEKEGNYLVLKVVRPEGSNLESFTFTNRSEGAKDGKTIKFVDHTAENAGWYETVVVYLDGSQTIQDLAKKAFTVQVGDVTYTFDFSGVTLAMKESGGGGEG